MSIASSPISAAAISELGGTSVTLGVFTVTDGIVVGSSGGEWLALIVDWMTVSGGIVVGDNSATRFVGNGSWNFPITTQPNGFVLLDTTQKFKLT